jgi:hypothetical protein
MVGDNPVMSDQSGQPPQDGEPDGPNPPQAPQPQFNPQTGYPSGEQPPGPPSYPMPGASNPYAGQQYGQPPYPTPGQPGWGQQPGMPPYAAYALPDHPKATTALVTGIVAVAGAFLCILPILASPVAWIIGAQARKEIRNAPHQWAGEGRATAGMVLGIVGTALLVLGLVFVAIMIAVAVGEAGNEGFEYDTGV